MKECSFCGEEFESEEELHVHWDEHGDELNSHQEEKVKKAKRRMEERKEQKMQKRKKYLGYGLAALLAVGFVGVIGAQLVGNGGGGQSTQIDLEGEPYIGAEDANVTVVEFGDYRCPVCGQFHSQVYDRPGSQPDLESEYVETGKIKFYFVNFAFLDQNFPGDTSTRAAVAGECVYNQDREQFWNFHKSLYENQGRENTDWATQETIERLFNQSTEGLDYGEFRSCVQNRDTIDEVNSDRRKGVSAGVSATPTVYVNGRKMQSWGYDSLSSAIDQELEN